MKQIIDPYSNAITNNSLSGSQFALCFTDAYAILKSTDLTLGHGWLITLHCFVWKWLFIHALISIMVKLIFISKRGPRGLMTRFAVCERLANNLGILRSRTLTAIVNQNMPPITCYRVLIVDCIRYIESSVQNELYGDWFPVIYPEFHVKLLSRTVGCPNYRY